MDLSGSSGGEFLCLECGDVVPTLRKLKCHRGKAHGVRRGSVPQASACGRGLP